MIKWTVVFGILPGCNFLDYEFVSTDEQAEEIEWVLKKYTDKCVVECEGIFRHLGLGKVIDDLKTYGRDLRLRLHDYEYTSMLECKSLRNDAAVSAITDPEERTKIKETIKEFVRYKLEKETEEE